MTRQRESVRAITLATGWLSRHADVLGLGAGADVDVDVVDVAHDVRVLAERRHHVFLRGRDVLAAAGDDAEELAIAEALERFLQCRREARSVGGGAMADVALGVIAAEAGI